MALLSRYPKALERLPSLRLQHNPTFTFKASCNGLSGPSGSDSLANTWIQLLSLILEKDYITPLLVLSCKSKSSTTWAIFQHRLEALLGQGDLALEAQLSTLFRIRPLLNILIPFSRSLGCNIKFLGQILHFYLPLCHFLFFIVDLQHASDY